MTMQCEQCSAPQPAGSDPSGFCCQCGQPLRAEAWCPWCTRRAPAGGFCRKCGCALVPPSLYGAARMLKAAGVDRLTLAERLEKMPAEQVQTFQHIFDEQRAIVERCVEELRICERFLVRRHHSRALEEALFPRLPFEDDELEALRAPRGAPADPTPETLAWLAANSRVDVTRRLASIAHFRATSFTRASFATVCRLLSDCDDVAQEAALALATWRLWRPGPAFATVPWFRHIEGNWRERLETCGNDAAVQPWVAVGTGMLDLENLRHPEGILEASLASADLDLALSAALVLGPERGGEAFLTRTLADRDAERRAAALYGLAFRGSPSVAGMLRDGSDDERDLALRLLKPPIHAALVEPVLCALERSRGEVPRLAVTALKAHMEESRVLRILPQLLQDGDVGALEALMRTPNLPCADDVVVGIFRAGLHERIVYGLDTLATDGLLSSTALVDLLVGIDHPSGRRRLIRLAEKCLERSCDVSLADAIVRIVFGCDAVEVRDDAACVLKRLESHRGDSFVPFSLEWEAVLRVFGRRDANRDASPGPGRTSSHSDVALAPGPSAALPGTGDVALAACRPGAACGPDLDGTPPCDPAVRACLEALTSALMDVEVEKHVILREWVANLLCYRFDEALVDRLAQDVLAFRDFLASLARATSGDCSALRDSAVRCLWMMSHQSGATSAVLPVVRALQDGSHVYDISYWLDRTIAEATEEGGAE